MWCKDKDWRLTSGRQWLGWISGLEPDSHSLLDLVTKDVSKNCQEAVVVSMTGGGPEEEVKLPWPSLLWSLYSDWLAVQRLCFLSCSTNCGTIPTPAGLWGRWSWDWEAPLFLVRWRVWIVPHYHWLKEGLFVRWKHCVKTLAVTDLHWKHTPEITRTLSSWVKTGACWVTHNFYRKGCVLVGEILYSRVTDSNIHSASLASLPHVEKTERCKTHDQFHCPGL